MIDSRSKILLKAIVEKYISDAEPIGSRSLSKISGLELSPASIRNIMADLEESGYITSIHTSSGRIPSNKGYRLFVDSLIQIRNLNNDQILQLKDKIDSEDPSQILTNASKALSQFTKFAGVVFFPKNNDKKIKHIEFLKLSSTKILVILVSSDGNVQNKVLLADKKISPSELLEATNYFNKNFSGMEIVQIKKLLSKEISKMKSNIKELLNDATNVGDEILKNRSDKYLISGESNLFDIKDFSSNLDKLKGLFELFETKTTLLKLLQSNENSQGIKIFIGQESGIFTLDECSVVTSSYEVDGTIVGSLGVIGPTRMSYDRVIPIVDITAKLLSASLSQQ